MSEEVPGITSNNHTTKKFFPAEKNSILLTFFSMILNGTETETRDARCLVWNKNHFVRKIWNKNIAVNIFFCNYLENITITKRFKPDATISVISPQET